MSNLKLVRCRDCAYWNKELAEIKDNGLFSLEDAWCLIFVGLTSESDYYSFGEPRKKLLTKDSFKPGDKFILEIGEKREFLDEYNIAGTDLYVRTSLLKKLPKMNPLKSEENEE